MSKSYQQLPILFDEDIETEIEQTVSRHDAINNISWSYSRREAFEQCPLRYYYAYYGANKKNSVSQGIKEQLHTLKASDNVHTRMGTILHLMISQSLKKAHDNPPFTVKDAIDWAKRLIQKDVEYSRKYPNLPQSKETYPPILLREYIDQPEEADGIYENAEHELFEAIRSFFTDERYSEFREGGSQQDAIIEHLIHLKTLPCKVTGRIDLAYVSSGIVTIVDWKSGESNGTGEDSLQLGTYGLWAVEHYNCSPEDLRVCKVYLGSGDIDFFPITEQILREARLRIIQDAERMAAVERWAKEGEIEIFTPNQQEKLCKLCAFKGVCYA